MSNRRQVSLMRNKCLASAMRWPHDPHIFHLLRKAVDPAPTSTESPQRFYSYFWCDGLTVETDT